MRIAHPEPMQSGPSGVYVKGFWGDYYGIYKNKDTIITARVSAKEFIDMMCDKICKLEAHIQELENCNLTIFKLSPCDTNFN